MSDIYNEIVAKRKGTKKKVVPEFPSEDSERRFWADMREAYRRQPDSGSESDSWSNCEKFEPRPATAPKIG
jgi:hypothetical protein